jgi:hypothetical protein
LSATNYTFSAANGTITINKAASTITATGTTSYTYTGLPQGPSTATVTGSTGAVSYSYSGTGTTTYAASATIPANAGTYQVIATVAADVNYNTQSSTALAFTISAKALTITGLTANNKPYDGGTNGTLSGTATYNGLVNGETLTVTGTPVATFASANVGTSVSVSVTGYSAPNTNYTVSQPTGLSANITALPITITATGPLKTYGTALTTGTSTSNFTVTGSLASGQSATSVTLTPNAAGLSATTAAGSAYTVTPSAATGTGGFLSSNYTITYVAYTGSVSGKALTITANGASKTYGSTLSSPVSGSTSFTSSGLYSTETIGSVTLSYGTGAEATANVGTYTGSVTPSAATGGTFNAANYSITYVGGTITVNKAVLTIKADNQSVCFGTPVATVTNAGSFTPTGFLNGDAAGVIGGTASYTTTYTATTAAATANVTLTPVLTGLTATNYSFTASNGTITINALPTAVTVSGGGTFCSSTTLTATGGTGGTIYFQGTSSGGTSTTLGGTPQTISNAGTYYFRAKNASGCWSTEGSAIVALTAPATTDASICIGGSGSLLATNTCSSSTLTAGANFAVTGASGGGSATAWSNPTRLNANDNSFVTVTGSGTAFTEALLATNFGFAIPSNATILGIQASYGRYKSAGGGADQIQDNYVKLIKGGNISGNNNGLTSTNWPTAEAAVNYGSISDLWGLTWTPADINSSNFGVALVIDGSGASVTASVDYVQITVTYSVPGSINWYTVASGGTSIGSGTSFNPVGVTGSGLANTNTAGTTTYYAECSSNPGCRSATDFVINALPTITGTTTICVGSSTTLTGSGTPAGTNAWTSSNTAVATVNASGVVSAIAAGSATITYTNNNACSITATVTVNAITSISSQSTAGQTICLNATFTPISVTAVGTGITYQWYSNVSSSNTGGTSISGATNSSYTPSAASTGTTYYYCTVTGSCGSSVTSTVSEAFVVNALPSAPTITKDYCVQPGSVKLTANSGYTSYLWNTGETTQSIFVDLAGNYSVTAYNGTCGATTNTSIATELVTNGGFESGATGFTSSYTNDQAANALATGGTGNGEGK